MINRLEMLDNLSDLLSNARKEAGKSQRDMSKALGKSIGTIQNWENGYATPNIIDTTQWVEYLGLNPLKFFLDYLYPDIYKNLKASDEDKDIEKALEKYITDIASASEKRKLAYCIFGNSGSSWESQLDMLTAHNHTTLRSRVNAAQVIMDSYDMEKARNELIGTDHIMPNENNLRDAIKYGKDSVIKGNNGYI